MRKRTTFYILLTLFTISNGRLFSQCRTWEKVYILLDSSLQSKQNLYGHESVYQVQYPNETILVRSLKSENIVKEDLEKVDILTTKKIWEHTKEAMLCEIEKSRVTGVLYLRDDINQTFLEIYVVQKIGQNYYRERVYWLDKHGCE